MLLGLVMMGGLYAAVVSPSSADEKSAKADEELINEGRQLFLVGCSFCHGQNGEGINSENGQYGPSLVGVGSAAVNFQMGTGRMPMQTPGQQAPAKAQVYNEDEIEAIGAFVASLGPGPATPTEAQISLDHLSEDDRRAAIVRGGQLFLTNCTACHNFDGSGGAMPNGKYAPSLKNTSRTHLYEAMLTGPQQMPNFSDGTLPEEEKKAIIKYIANLQSGEAPGGLALGSFGPVTEGVFVWTAGIGILLAFAVWIGAKVR